MPTPPPPTPPAAGFTVTVDLADFFDVPAPLPKPSGKGKVESVLDHGADPAGKNDSAPAFDAAVLAAGTGGTVWGRGSGCSAPP